MNAELTQSEHKKLKEAFRDKLLPLIAAQRPKMVPGRLYRRDAATGEWADIGPMHPVTAKHQKIAREARAQRGQT